MKHKRLKTYHFFISWVLTLLTGLILGSLAGIGVGLITTVIAGLSSLPFIILFLILQHLYLKKQPTKSQLHTRTFLLHITGAFLVFAGYFAFGEGRNNDTFALIGVMSGYFAVDSIFFHAFIQTLYEDAKIAVHPDVLDILD